MENPGPSDEDPGQGRESVQLRPDLLRRGVNRKLILVRLSRCCEGQSDEGADGLQEQVRHEFGAVASIDEDHMEDPDHGPSDAHPPNGPDQREAKRLSAA
jgi:hypothetical protein